MIGVITKTDLCRDKERTRTGKEILEIAGAQEILEIGFGDEACIETLKSRIENSPLQSRVLES